MGLHESVALCACVLVEHSTWPSRKSLYYYCTFRIFNPFEFHAKNGRAHSNTRKLIYLLFSVFLYPHRPPPPTLGPARYFGCILNKIYLVVDVRGRLEIGRFGLGWRVHPCHDQTQQVDK